MRGRYALLLLAPPGLPVVRSYLTRQGAGGREGLRGARPSPEPAASKQGTRGHVNHSGPQYSLYPGCDSQELKDMPSKVILFSYTNYPSLTRNLERAGVKMGQNDLLRHGSFTFDLQGVSRAASHQIVRHRIASFSQQ